ncbi:MAG: MaoC family dehydratase [Lachnospiraceae bacterium]|nr:MaoC family dehydratase [Lachnospiraceae bacterium]
MNAYTYEEIEIGHTETFEVTVTEESLDAFRGITGDVNPLHRDDEFAKARGMKGHVAFGLLTASYLSALAGVYLPGKRSLVQSLEIKFASPVYPGDTLTVSGEVTEKNDAYRVLRLKVAVRNGKGEKVLRGTMQIGFTEEGHG